MKEMSGFQLLERLHSNNSTEVFRAKQIEDQQEIILKIARSDMRQDVIYSRGVASLQREYHLLNRLKIKGLIEPKGFLKFSDCYVLVMENILGQTLQAFINKKPVKLKDFFNIALQLIEILSELHYNKIIHKDIKPSNILINPETLEIKLIDLSIASPFVEETQEYAAPQVLEGTLAYISPEQTGRMNHNINQRADLYSLGVTFYEMLTGHVPFLSEDPLKLIHCQLAQIPPDINLQNPNVPAMVAQIVHKLLEKAPEARYGNAAALKVDLEECYSQWQAKSNIVAFKLGRLEQGKSLSISNKLYGREKDVEILVEAIDNLKNVAIESEMRTDIVLISGFSGSGKTMLVKEIYKSMSYQNCYFIKGKFDQLQQISPFKAIIEAFRNLLIQILTEPDENLERFRTTLLHELDVNAQVIIDLLPELQFIIGPQGESTVLGAIEAKNRFNILFQKFIQVFAQAHHPLVLFLDDMQWADHATLGFIEYVFTTNKISNFLLIAAYRDNEVNEHHPFTCMLDSVKKNNVKIKSINLQPLKVEHIECLLADTFVCQHEQILELARYLHEQSHGIPFFVCELIKNWYENNFFTYNDQTEQWNWNFKQLVQQNFTHNIIDLLIVKIKRLPQTLQEILKKAACIGNSFNLETLSMVDDMLPDNLIYLLNQGIEQGLLLVVKDSNMILWNATDLNDVEKAEIYNYKLIYKFRHDRIQQTIYSSLDENEKGELHTKIGRLLLNENRPLNVNNENVFDIVNHLNFGIEKIKNHLELVEYVKLNLLAGQKAKNSIAFDAHKHYLEIAKKLLLPEMQKTEYQLYFDVCKEYAESLFLTGNLKAAEIEMQKTLAIANSKFDKSQVLQLCNQFYMFDSQYSKALMSGLEALKILGFNLNEKARIIDIIDELLKFSIRRLICPIEKLADKLKVIDDPEKLSINKNLILSIEPSYITNQIQFAYLICKAMNFNMTYGKSSYTSLTLVHMAILLIFKFKNFKLALKLIEQAKILAVEFPEPTILSRYYLFIGIFIGHWESFAKINLEYINQAFQLCFSTGDIAFAGLAKLVEQFVFMFLNIPLIDNNKSIQKSMLFLKQGLYGENYDFLNYFYLNNNYLIGEKISYQELESALDKVKSNSDVITVRVIYSVHAKLLYLNGKYSEGLVYSQKAIEVTNDIQSHIYEPETLFIHALCLFANYSDFNGIKEKRNFWSQIKRILSYYKIWSQQTPKNYSSRYLMLLAEKAKIHRNYQQCIDYYEKSIELSQSNDFVLIQAMASEALARYLLSFKKEKIAKFYLQEAYSAYQRGNYFLINRQLEQEFSNWLKPVSYELDENIFESKTVSVKTTYAAVNNFDFLSILKSIQVLASEIKLDLLLQKLLVILQENAGAQRSVLLRKKSENWYIEADGTITNQSINLDAEPRMEQYNNIPLTLVNYVLRTKQPLIISDAQVLELSIGDPYVKEGKIRSILILPILRQSKMDYIIYLENNSMPGMFTEKHVQILQILASQLVISLDNAYLYHQATQDPLTKLANRNYLYQTFKQKVRAAKRHKKLIAILFFDLDHFKRINDTLGHEVGDLLLIYIADTLRSVLRDYELAARLGGDEFIIMLESLDDISQAKVIVERVYNAFSQPAHIQGHILPISLSMGVSFYPFDGDDIQTLIKKADTALYYSKSQGRGQYYFYHHQISELMHQDNINKLELQNAFNKKEFFLVYQPIFDLKEQKIVGIEALLRWNHPSKGVLAAKNFMDLLESTGLIVAVTEWVLTEACQQMAIWRRQGLSEVPLAVNISGLQFKKDNLYSKIINILNLKKLKPQDLVLEITESILIENLDVVLREIKSLVDLGIEISIDDFGTGYSSLIYLKNLPAKKIKLSKEFIENVAVHHSEDQIIVKSITSLAHQLNLKVIAEGVETIEQYHFLKTCLVDQIQGHLWSFPLTQEECTSLFIEKGILGLILDKN